MLNMIIYKTAPPTSAAGAPPAGFNSTMNQTKLAWFQAWFGKCSHLNEFVNVEQMMKVDASIIQSATVVQDLGVLLDQELSTTQHIGKVT